MSIHPLLRLAATHPHLLADHAAAYAELLGDEMGKTVLSWKQKALFNAMGIGLFGVGAVLAGVAAMLWALIPAPPAHASWALIAAPAVPTLLALLCIFAGRRSAPDAFTQVKQQLGADLSMLREVSTAAVST